MKKVSLGYYSLFPLFHHYSAPSVENSVLIPNNKGIEGYIGEIKFKLSNTENSIWNLRIRLREVDTITGLPKNTIPIFQSDIPAITLNKRTGISIKDYNISLSLKGIFVSLEWVFMGQMKDIRTLGPGIAGKRVSERTVFFRYENSSEWKTSPYAQRTSFYYASADGSQLFAPSISIIVSTPDK